MSAFQFDTKKLIPHLVAVISFFVVSVITTLPAFEGKVLSAHDDIQYRGAAKESEDFRESTGEEPLWNSSMFSGMPNYLITFKAEGNFVENVIYPIIKFGLPNPTEKIFIALLSFYIMLLTFKIDPWTSIIGALGFGLTTYHYIILGAGHFNKMAAIAFIPLIIAGINLIFQKEYLWGSVITGLGMSLEMVRSHPQMTYYYFVFFISLYILYLFIDGILKKEFKHAVIASVLVGLMLGIGGLTSLNRLLPTNEYSAYSTRGKTELVSHKKAEEQSSGLDKSYIVGYSFGKGDVFSFWIPNFKGPKNGVMFENKEAKEAVKGSDRSVLKSFDQYWGGQDASGGALYSGAVIFFLFVLGIFIVKHPVKWVILFSVCITFLLSLGKNYMELTNLFIDHFPMYNKFRAVNSILVVMELTVPILAALALYEMVKNKNLLEEKLKIFSTNTNLKKEYIFYGVYGITGVLALVAYVLPGMFQTFFQPGETEEISKAVIGQGGSDADVTRLLQVAETARIAIFKADAIRTFIIISLGAGLIWAYFKNKISSQILIGCLAVITIADLYTVNGRYLTEKNYKKPTELIRPNVANRSILEDKDPNFRVANLTVSTFNDGTTSYFHKSIGGYHGAKMERYQELIEFGITPDMMKLSQSGSMDVFKSMLVLNMLNTKYYIVDPNQAAIRNPETYGNAWIVNNIVWANDADDELNAMEKNNLKQTAIIDKRFEKEVLPFQPSSDSTASIQLVSYSPVNLKYEFNSVNEQFVVFSEIFYDKGWNATIDGKEASHVRANYVLRAMKVPAGKHTIEFDFTPESYEKGKMISQASSSILILLLVIGLAWEIKKRMAVQKK